MSSQREVVFNRTERQSAGSGLGEARAIGIKPTVRWAFCALIFSLPFELPKVGLPLEVTTLTACIFLLATLLQPRVCFRPPPRAFWCFVLYLYVYVFLIIWHSSGYRNPDLQRDQAKLLFLLFQLILMCWAACNILREDRTAKAALLTLGAACTILSVMHILGVARSATEVASNVQRLTTLGQNPNSLARHLAIGILALVGLAYGRRDAAFPARFLVWPLVILILMAIASTGARGSALALGAGLLVFTIGGKSASQRVRNILVVILAIGFCVWVFMRTDTMEQRFVRSIDEGSMSQRENLYPAAWGMFLDKPLLGWGPTINMWELGARVGDRNHPFRDTHDLLLEILTVTGVLGAVPFFMGTFLCLRAAWSGRRGREGILPLAMMAAILVANVGANLHYNKLYWLLMAYALASDSRFLHVRSRLVAMSRRSLNFSGRRLPGFAQYRTKSV